MGLKLEEIITKDLSSVNKTIKVLQYLNYGLELKLGDYTFRVSETLNGGFSLLYKMIVTSQDKTEREEWFGYQAGIMHFSEICNKLTDDELTLMSATITLNEINKR